MFGVCADCGIQSSGAITISPKFSGLETLFWRNFYFTQACKTGGRRPGVSPPLVGGPSPGGESGRLGPWDRGTSLHCFPPLWIYGFKPPVHSGASVRRSGAQTASESLRSQADQLAVPDSPSVVAGDMIGDTPQHPSTRPSLSLNILTMLIALRYYKKRPPALFHRSRLPEVPREATAIFRKDRRSGALLPFAALPRPSRVISRYYTIRGWPEEDIAE